MDDHHPENFIVTDNIDAYASSNHLNARHVLIISASFLAHGNGSISILNTSSDMFVT